MLSPECSRVHPMFPSCKKQHRISHSQIVSPCDEYLIRDGEDYRRKQTTLRRSDKHGEILQNAQRCVFPAHLGSGTLFDISCIRTAVPRAAWRASLN